MNPAQTPELRQLLTLLTLAAFASSASFRVCDPMLPVLAGLFDAPAGRVARIITGFTIAYGAMQLIYGPLGERFDRFRIVTLATALCAVGSLGATLATRLDVLTLCRILTGVAAAGIIPMSIPAIAGLVPAGRGRQADATAPGGWQCECCPAAHSYGTGSLGRNSATRITGSVNTNLQTWINTP